MDTDVVIALVGRQPMPVLMPILQYAPQFVHLIYTRQTRGVAEHIRAVCKSLPECTTRVRLAEPDVLPYNSADTEKRCAEKAKADSGKVVVNITSGTTPMTLGALHVAQQLKLEMIYVDTDENRILRLDPDGREIARDPINVSVSVKTYVEAHGAILTAARKDPWATRFYEAAELLGSAGTGSVRLMDEMRLAVSRTEYQPRIDVADEATVCLAKQLESLNILADVIAAPGVPLSFRVVDNPDARDFAGQWLELFVAQRLKNATDKPFNVEMQKYVRRKTDKGDVRNEIDVLVTQLSRLAAISCKTGRLREDTDDAKQPIYEMDSVLPTDLMGLYCKKILVTNRPSGDIPDSSVSRAHLSKIKIITGDRLMDIADLVSDYLLASDVTE